MPKPPSARGEDRVLNPGHIENYARALRIALYNAADEFFNKHGRPPSLEDLNFKGGFTTVNVVIEIEEAVY